IDHSPRASAPAARPAEVSPVPRPGGATASATGDASARSPIAGRPGRDPMTTLQGRAPGPRPAPPHARDRAPSQAGPVAAGDASSGRAVERSPIAGRPPPGRDPMTTLQGRAPGPTPGSADRTGSAEVPEDGRARSAIAPPGASGLAVPH